MEHFFEAIRAVLTDPPQRHAALVHLPIAISVVGVAATIALLCTLGRSVTLRWVCIGLYALGIVTALVAASAGEAADEHFGEVHTELMTPAARETLEHHEDLAEPLWAGMAATAALLAVGLVRRPAVRIASSAVGLAGAVIVVVWVTVAAQHGGALVYEHGVGVPGSANNYEMAAPAGGSQTHGDDGEHGE